MISGGQTTFVLPTIVPVFQPITPIISPIISPPIMTYATAETPVLQQEGVQQNDAIETISMSNHTIQGLPTTWRYKQTHVKS